MAFVSFNARAAGDGLKRSDYDRKEIRKALRKVGSEVRKTARRMVSRKAVSAPGEAPGRQSGVLRKSIKAKVSRSGYSVSIYPDKTADMDVFYPAFVVYGHRGPGSETAKEARSHRARVGKKVAQPRANYVVEAAAKHERSFERSMADVLGRSILPGYFQ